MGSNFLGHATISALALGFFISLPLAAQTTTYKVPRREHLSQILKQLGFTDQLWGSEGMMRRTLEINADKIILNGNIVEAGTILQIPAPHQETPQQLTPQVQQETSPVPAPPSAPAPSQAFQELNVEPEQLPLTVQESPPLNPLPLRVVFEPRLMIAEISGSHLATKDSVVLASNGTFGASLAAEVPINKHTAAVMGLDFTHYNFDPPQNQSIGSSEIDTFGAFLGSQFTPFRFLEVTPKLRVGQGIYLNRFSDSGFFFSLRSIYVPSLSLQARLIARIHETLSYGITSTGMFLFPMSEGEIVLNSGFAWSAGPFVEWQRSGSRLGVRIQGVFEKRSQNSTSVDQYYSEKAMSVAVSYRI